MAASVWRTLTRRKVIKQPEESSLGRVLGTFDLTFLGVGATLGVGLYVLVGKVAKETAGPSIVLSFLIAAIASAFAGLCYAEFGARVPRAGSAYIYSYVCVGEFIAFIIGWNLILEYVIGSASVAHGMSLYIDALANDSMKNAFMEIAPIHISFLAQYFDFFAFAVSILLSIALAFGLKESSVVNNIITCLNIAVVLFVIIAGATKADINNWRVSPGESGSHAGIGQGGFFPFGVSGMIKGAATCFYGFIGFDCIATTGEEARNPRRAIPIAILSSLGISFLAYVGTSIVITLMIPYYQQDINSPIPFAFDYYEMTTGKWIVTLGGCFALTASLFGAMFPLPRIIYAMANDGVIFRFLGIVSERFATPVIGTITAGILTGLLGALFEQGQLVDMMSIGTLLAYTIVAACVLILRYSDDLNLADNDDEAETPALTLGKSNTDNKGWLSQIFNLGCAKRPTKKTEKLVTIQVFVFCMLCIIIGIFFKFMIDDIADGELYAIILTSIVVVAMIVVLLLIVIQPQSTKHLSFKVPLVPLIPALSILVNIYLMMSLDVSTWIRFGVWMAIGLPIYYCSVCNTCCANNRNGDGSIDKNRGTTPSMRLAGFACAKSRNMSEGSTYVNFGYLNGGEAEMAEVNTSQRETEREREREREREMNGERENKSSGVDSDSGAYFDENEHQEAEFESKSVQDVLVPFDNMLDKEEEKCGDFINVGLLRGRNRSVSIVSSISNNSNNLPVEESVVAIIHREDEPPKQHEPILEQSESENENEEEFAKNQQDLQLGLEAINENESEVKIAEINVIPAEGPSESEEISDISSNTQPETLQEPESRPEPGSDEVTIPPPPPPPPFPPLMPQISQVSTNIESDSDTDDDQMSFHSLQSQSHSPATSTFSVYSTPETPPAQHLPPPPPPSMDKFETYKTRKSPLTPDISELSLARSALKKTQRPITPPPTPQSIRSTRSQYIPEDNEDNLKLHSDVAKKFKDKLQMDLGVAPKNLRFSILPSSYTYSTLDRPGDKSETGDKDEEASAREGVDDESLKNINKDDIRQRLTELFQSGGGINGFNRRPTNRTERSGGEGAKDGYGETKA